jgi:hypothetical protein
LGEAGYAEVAKRLPEVPEQEKDSTRSLTPAERAEYEVALGILARVESAWWIQGRVWEYIRKSGAYGEDYGTWEDFCQIFLQKTARRINQTIELWRLGEYLLVNVASRYPTVAVNEAHVRGLFKFANANGENGFEAAAFVLEALMRSQVVLTKDRIEAAVAALPPGPFAPETAAPVLAAFVNDGIPVIPAKSDGDEQEKDPVVAVVRTLRARVGRVAKENPDATRRLIDELAALLDELRKQLDG